NKINRLPGKSFLDNPYAVNVDKSILHNVPPTVIVIDTKIDLRIVFVENINLYALKVNFVWNNRNFVSAISTPVANELPSIRITGITVKSPINVHKVAFTILNKRAPNVLSPITFYPPNFVLTTLIDAILTKSLS